MTTIFRIMENVFKQKMENIDVYRQYSWNSTGAQEQAALSAAQATVLEGQLEAAAQRAQATGTLISAGLAMGLGFVSMGLTVKATAQVSEKYDKQINDLDKSDPIAYQKSLSELTLAKQHALQTTLQSDVVLQVFKVLDQTLPQIAQGISQIVGAGYTAQAAYAKAASMLWQQMIQSQQNITQEMQQAIQASSRDASDMLDTAGRIAQSVTSQSG